MQRLSSNALRRSSAGCSAWLAVSGLRTTRLVLVPRREVSSSAPPANGSAESIRSPPELSVADATQGAPELDTRAAEEVRLAQDLGEQAFGENTEILKKVAARGLRSFVVCAVGLGVFTWAMKKKKRELEATAPPAVEAAGDAHAERDEDPTQRYLHEMRGLGFDVDTLEEELEHEQRAKATALRQRAGL
ncbi:hypothetical protein LPMP_342430 [Leishmania panamensis]|uniref:Uncharacterized protein n=3 Tax=Leishmania guyanensis species complex TaxID=38579 RepID=A0A088S0T0_LEIPA|nr:hypothetical protein LPMP_342430 [Leishmania panamensis]AIO01869.1 hypothetical protein LPMP_342430 [Leishmania panamensis]CCM19086.1 hypothetical protein, conserved [Leishmania guyanensis]